MFICDVCNRFFNRRDNLTRHVRIHSGTKLSCTICTSQFSRQDALTRHMKSKHNFVEIAPTLFGPVDQAVPSTFEDINDGFENNDDDVKLYEKLDYAGIKNLICAPPVTDSVEIAPTIFIPVGQAVPSTSAIAKNESEHNNTNSICAPSDTTMQSNVAETFRDGTVLVTGCTGFLGKLLTEKLLRSCPVKTIAIIVRNKKGFTAEQRVENIYKETVFDCLREKKPNFINQIKVIDGYLESPDLGISSTDREWIIENVNFVFHCAATVRFNEPLEKAIQINIQGTEKLLTLATEIKNIKGFVHVSTAYSNFYLDEIKEQFYSVPVTAEDLYDLLDIEDSSIKNNSILGRWPNTYSFTKAITENLIPTNENRLPISIFRPSIIGCTQSEPFSGWVENLNAATGVITGLILGITRTLPMYKVTHRLDIIPIDYTVNALISVMWDTVQRYQDSSQEYKEPKIFNFVSGVESPLTYADFFNNIFNSYREAPPLSAVWYYFCIFTINPLAIKVLRFLLHKVPSTFMDLCLLLIGRKPKYELNDPKYPTFPGGLIPLFRFNDICLHLQDFIFSNNETMKMYEQLELSHDLLRSFVVKNWTFHNNNTRELWSLLSHEDRKTFWYSFEEFDFEEYIKIYVQAVRKCILGEAQSNVKEALAKTRRLFWMHHLCIILLLYFVSHLFWKFIKLCML